MSSPERVQYPSAFALLAMALIASACGRTEVFTSSAPQVDVGTERVCLELCLEVEQELRESFGVAEPCSEGAWSRRAFDCEACAQLFVDFYGVALDTSACRDCRDEVPPAACGVPPPDCPLGSRPGIERCTGACAGCWPSFTGGCVPCADRD